MQTREFAQKTEAGAVASPASFIHIEGIRAKSGFPSVGTGRVADAAGVALNVIERGIIR